MPLLLESYGSFKGKHAYWNFHFLGLLFSSYVEAAPLSLLFCTIRSKLFPLPFRSEYETYLMFCCGAQIFFMKCECLQCVKVKEFSVWLQRRSERIFSSSVANFQVFMQITLVMSWTQFHYIISYKSEINKTLFRCAKLLREWPMKDVCTQLM